ncbi:hypothetical protein D3C71_2100930 [compost metagenome]
MKSSSGVNVFCTVLFLADQIPRGRPTMTERKAEVMTSASVSIVWSQYPRLSIRYSPIIVNKAMGKRANQ